MLKLSKYISVHVAIGASFMVNGLAGGSVSVYGALIINTSTGTNTLATSTKNTYTNSAKS
jgi:hypothetical protein